MLRNKYGLGRKWTFNETGIRRGPKPKSRPLCKVCGKPCKKLNREFCSVECRTQVRRNIKKCIGCGKEFWHHNSKIKYHSLECYRNSCLKNREKHLITRNCKKCGKEFQTYESGANRKYCSPECYQTKRIYVRGPEHPNWKGGTFVSSHGHLYEIDHTKSFDELRNCYPYIATHIRVMQEKLNRQLKKDEHVHHVDGDKLNNEPSNLIVLSSSEHKTLHNKFGEWAIEHHKQQNSLFEITTRFLNEIHNKV